MSPEERRLYDGVADFVRDVVAESEPKEFPRWHFLLLVLQKEMGSATAAAEDARAHRAGLRAERQAKRARPAGRAGARSCGPAKVEGLVQI